MPLGIFGEDLSEHGRIAELVEDAPQQRLVLLARRHCCRALVKASTHASWFFVDTSLLIGRAYFLISSSVNGNAGSPFIDAIGVALVFVGTALIASQYAVSPSGLIISLIKSCA